MTAPTQIGRYEILGEIGRGGMAAIYSARDPISGREVAIKILPTEFGKNKELIARFHREMRAVAALEHPGIVPVYDFGEHENQPYFVMRLMQGGSLNDHLRNGPLSLEQTAWVIERIAPALDEAHEKGIIHRDLKPANILFDHHGDPFITDFGIAKIAESGVSLTHGAIVGTPAYMSPEQGSGDPHIDHLSDIYSLGVILFEMLTGRIPFRADTPMAQVMMHITEPIPDIQVIRPGLPSEVQVIISTAMAKRKFIRYRKALYIADALNSVISGYGLPLFQDGSSDTQIQDVSASPQDSAKSDALKISTGPLSKPITPSKGMAPISSGKPLTPPGAKRYGNTPPGNIRNPSTPPRGLSNNDPVEAVNQSASDGRITPKPFIVNKSLVIFLGIALILVIGIGAIGLIPPPANFVPVLSLTPNPITSAPTFTSIPTLTIGVVSEQTDTPTPDSVRATPTLEFSPTPPLYSMGGADKIAFVKGNDIWVSDLDARNIKQLTTTGGSKSGLNWTPDGQAVIFLSGLCVQMVDIHTSIVTTVMCFNWANYLASFSISPKGDQVAISMSDGLFILPYQLADLKAIDRQDEFISAQACVRYDEFTTKEVKWSQDSQNIAVVIVASELGRPVDVIRVLDVSKCGSRPTRKDDFPGTRFTMKGYEIDPTIQSFGWDGNILFALNLNKLNGFGDLYIYNGSSYHAEVVNPLGGNSCCYRDFTWTPDGQYLMFAYQDINIANVTYLYLVPYGRIGTGENFSAIPFPEDFFIDRRERIQPVLRPIR